MADISSDATSGKNATPSKLALEVSLGLYEDSIRGGTHTLASGVVLFGDRNATAEEIDTIQMARNLNGLPRYPHQPYFSEGFSLDNKTASEILANPLTKQALPFASIGYLYDRLESIQGPGGKITLDSLLDYQKSKQVANPLEAAMISFAVDNFDIIYQMSESQLDRKGLYNAAIELERMRGKDNVDGEMGYLQKNYFDLTTFNPNSGITNQDLEFKKARSNDPAEKETIDKVQDNFNKLRAFNEDDGESYWVPTPLYSMRRYITENSKGVTDRDISAWQAQSKSMNRMGLSYKEDQTVKNYYDSVRQQLSAGPSMADRIYQLTPKP